MENGSKSWRVSSSWRLTLAAVALAASACGVSEPSESPLSDPSGQAREALACGRIASGETLYPNQSVGSCNAKANLVHQSDGNVVLYDAVGALWTTNTYGKATTGLSMQTDGNLVLYANTGAVWFTGTGGNSGAKLAIQDDCNLVVVSTTGKVLWTSNTACRSAPVDPLNYMLNTSGCTLKDSGGGTNQTRQDTANKRFWIQKNPNESDRWERYGYDSSRIYLDRDTTLPTTDGPGSAYDVSPANGLYFPRAWSVGSVVNFDVYIKYFNHRLACSYLSGKDLHWNQGRHKLRYQGPIDLGGQLGTLSDVIIIDRYNDLSVDPYQPPGGERFWYARGYGWVRWESWNDRTKDSRWDSNSVANLSATTPTTRVTWNIKWCGNVAFSDVCTALHP